MDKVSLTPYLQEKLKQAQNLQQQLEAVIAQVYQLDQKVKELSKTLETLQKTDASSKLYKSIGSILVEVKDKAQLEKEMNEDKETVQIRLETMKKQQKFLEDKYKEIQSEFTKVYSQKSE